MRGEENRKERAKYYGILEKITSMYERKKTRDIFL